MPHPTHEVAVYHPEAGRYVGLNPAINYDPEDILVKRYPWAFEPKPDRGRVESVSIESASAAPGEKRTRSKK